MKAWLALARQDADQAIAAAIRDDGRKVSCRGRGCSACCQGPVAAVADEVDAILAVADDATKARIADYHVAKACPLLDPTTQSCSVYAHRPLTCRVYVSFSPPAWCANEGKVERAERPRLGRLLQSLYGDREFGILGELLRQALR